MPVMWPAAWRQSTRARSSAVPSRELFDGAMAGMVDVLDRHGDDHSQFLSDEEADPLRRRNSPAVRRHRRAASLRGRAAAADDRLSARTWNAGRPGQSARRATISWRSTAPDRQSMKMDEVLHLMRGEPGTTVSLDDSARAMNPASRTVELVREIIEIESIFGDRRGPDGKWQFLLPVDPRIAHVRIALFGDHTAPGTVRVLDESAGRRRSRPSCSTCANNAGGALEAAVAVCELLAAGRADDRGNAAAADGTLRRRTNDAAGALISTCRWRSS